MTEIGNDPRVRDIENSAEVNGRIAVEMARMLRVSGGTDAALAELIGDTWVHGLLVGLTLTEPDRGELVTLLRSDEGWGELLEQADCDEFHAGLGVPS